MKKLRRGISITVGVLTAGFAGLWIAGPEPVSMGPYVQNVTKVGADICWFDEVPRRIEVIVDAATSGETDKVFRELEPVAAHRVRVEGLVPNTRYEYGVRDLDSSEHEQLGYGSFRTAPEDPGASFTFAAVGDSGKVPSWFKMRRFGWGRLRAVRLTSRPGQWDVGAWIAAQRPDFFVHLGDIIYSHDQLPAYEEAFFRPFGGVLRQASLVATLGNHDMHTWEDPEFFRLFHPPKRLDPAKRHTDFSHTFVWGSVRFFVLDAFWQKWQPGSPMRTWLAETLRNSLSPRAIVIMHHPPFSDEKGVTEHVAVRDALWPIFAKHEVDLVISGDSHNYQRFAPIDGVTPVIVGTGGKSIRPVDITPRLAHVQERFGFLLVKVAGSRIEGEFWAGDAEPLDRFVVTK